MNLFQKLAVNAQNSPAIDWEITPALTFTIFESWGSRERIRSNRERFYYFFIDNNEQPATLCLMERGIKFARVLARIIAPQELIDRCVASQGRSSSIDQSYAVDDTLRQWLVENVLDADDDSKVIPLTCGMVEENMATELPAKESAVPPLTRVLLGNEAADLSEEELPRLIKRGNFFESKHNPAGSFPNYLVDNGDGRTVSDLVTEVMWQRGGCDLTSIRNMHATIKKLNEQRFAGYDDWRLPTVEEALSIMTPERNDKGLHLHPCFSMAQPFIFLAAQRRPGGYWFADFKQGVIFWASGTIPGGFGRVCRTITG